MIGLKRGVVELADHDPEWKVIADDTIKRLWDIVGLAAKDIQHVGSTAIVNIKAKPIIDIAVAVDDFDVVMELVSVLKENGFIYRKRENHKDESLLFACGDYSKDDGIITHFIHVVKSDGEGFLNYLRFRDYMNTHFDEAKAYETLKLRLMNENPIDPGREKYLAGKKDFIVEKLMLARLWNNFGCKFTKIEPITKGWSEDKKYCVTTANNIKYLLRITPISRYETRKSLFAMLEKVAALDIPMCTPVEFGICDDGVYALHSWIDGEDLEVVLSRLSESEQYIIGYKAGEILRKMHNIFVSDIQSERPDWAESFDHTTDKRIQKYRDCGVRFTGDDRVLDYLKQNQHLIETRPRCFQHGDYSVRNIMIENGELKIIDFERLYFGDPWEDFAFVMLDAPKNQYFWTGQFRGYFGGDPPLEFLQVYAFYVLSSLLPGIYETELDEINKMLEQTQEILSWFDDLSNPVPKWYLKDFHVQWTDGIPYKLKAPFDFSFISEYGKVFKVFDDQDSGNICFGVKADENKYFLKFAGAPTERANINAEETVQRMKNTVQIYRDLEHPILPKLIKAEEIGGGFAMVFEWTDGECMGKQYPLAREKFQQMPIDIKRNIFDDIVDFHAYVAKQGYVAIDFYDGSIMYDFNENKTVICDIEFYSKKPYFNKMGRMWGSSRFMSPEEFQFGAVIDEITNVYAMGATAFALFGDEWDRSIEKWRLSKELFYVAKRAVSDDRNIRQQSIEQFIKEWNEAKAGKI